MKPITFAQWNKMNSHQRSWLVCKLLGRRARVFWSFHRQDGGTVGGSYDSLRYCQMLRDHALTLTPAQVRDAGWGQDRHPFADCTIRCSAAYPLYAENDHSIHELIDYLTANGAVVTITAGRGAKGSWFRCTSKAGKSKSFSLRSSLADCVCQTFLAAHGLLTNHPSDPSDPSDAPVTAAP